MASRSRKSESSAPLINSPQLAAALQAHLVLAGVKRPGLYEHNDKRRRVNVHALDRRSLRSHWRTDEAKPGFRIAPGIARRSWSTAIVGSRAPSRSCGSAHSRLSTRRSPRSTAAGEPAGGRRSSSEEVFVVVVCRHALAFVLLEECAERARANVDLPADLRALDGSLPREGERPALAERRRRDGQPLTD
jgi:hypothetical protein